jgi:hypothetical protein|tara:strand:- start:157 stop:438 length:282 start_codon:yes stop_codon:yes gene_type:complete
MKKFRVQIRAYKMYADFKIECEDGPLDIENAIIDKLGKNDIKWESLGEMHDPRVNRITYEEVINGGDNATTGKPIFSKESVGSRMGAGASERG